MGDQILHSQEKEEEAGELEDRVLLSESHQETHKEQMIVLL